MPPPATGIDRNLTHYAAPGFSRYLRRAFLASAGYDEADLERPVVGIADTSSDCTTCHRAMPQLVEAVKRGVLHLPKSPMGYYGSSVGWLCKRPSPERPHSRGILSPRVGSFLLSFCSYIR